MCTYAPAHLSTHLFIYSFVYLLFRGHGTRQKSVPKAKAQQTGGRLLKKTRVPEVGVANVGVKQRLRCRKLTLHDGGAAAAGSVETADSQPKAKAKGKGEGRLALGLAAVAKQKPMMTRKAKGKARAKPKAKCKAKAKGAGRGRKETQFDKVLMSCLPGVCKDGEASDADSEDPGFLNELGFV